MTAVIDSDPFLPAAGDGIVVSNARGAIAVRSSDLIVPQRESAPG